MGSPLPDTSEADAALAKGSPSPDISLSFKPLPDTSEADAALGSAIAAPSPQAGAANPPAPEPVPDSGPQPDSWGKDIQEFIYPTKLKSEGGVVDEEHEKKPDWYSMPEMSTLLSIPSIRAILATPFTGSEATKDILKARFGIDAKQDGAYWIAKSKVDGKEYAWKPGLRKSDFERGALGAAEFSGGAKLAAGLVGLIPGMAAAPAVAGATAQSPGTLATIAAGVGHGLAGSTATEAAKYAGGGGFSLPSIAGQGVLGGVMATPGAVMEALQNRIMGGAAAGTMEDTGQLLGRGARGNNFAQQEFVNRLGTDAATRTAAQNLGADVTPDVLAATTPVGQEALAVSQAAKSSGGNAYRVADTAARSNASKAILARLEQMGGEADNSVVNHESEEAIRKLHSALDQRVKILYKNLVPPETPLAPEDLADVRKYIANYKGSKLPKLLKRIQSQLTEEPGTVIPPSVTVDPSTLNVTTHPGGTSSNPLTYQDLDSITQETGSATKGPDIWKSPAKGLSKDAYRVLNSARDKVAERLGKITELADAQDAFKERTQFQEDLSHLLGNQIKGVIAGDVSPGVDTALKSAAKGAIARLARTSRAISKLPPDVQNNIVVSGVINMMRGASEEEPISIPVAEKMLNGLLTNSKALPIIGRQLGPNAVAGLTDMKNLASGVMRMVRAQVNNGRAEGIVRQLATADAIAGKVADAIETGGRVVGTTAGAVVGHAAGEGIIGTGEGANMGRIIGGGMGKLMGRAIRGDAKDIVPKVAGFLTSPEFRALANSSTGTNPVPPSVLRQTVNSGVFSSMMDALKQPSGTRGGWLRGVMDTAHSATQAAGHNISDRMSRGAQ